MVILKVLKTNNWETSHQYRPQINIYTYNKESLSPPYLGRNSRTQGWSQIFFYTWCISRVLAGSPGKTEHTFENTCRSFGRHCELDHAMHLRCFTGTYNIFLTPKQMLRFSGWIFNLWKNSGQYYQSLWGDQESPRPMVATEGSSCQMWITRTVISTARLQVSHSKDKTLANTPAPLKKDGLRDEKEVLKI